MSDVSTTDLPEPDAQAASAMWLRYLAASGDVAGPGYTDLTCFGDSVEVADELLGLMLFGPKRATAGSVAEYQSASVAYPGWGTAGSHATGGAGRGR